MSDVHDKFDVTDLPDARSLALQIAKHLSRATDYESSGRDAEQRAEVARARKACDALQVALDQMRGGE